MINIYLIGEDDPNKRLYTDLHRHITNIYIYIDAYRHTYIHTRTYHVAHRL